MSDQNYDLAARVADLEDQMLDLKQRTRFLEVLLDVSIRMTDIGLRDHIQFIVDTLEDTSMVPDNTKILAQEYAVHLRKVMKSAAADD